MQNKVLIALFMLLVGVVAFCMIFLMERYEKTIWTGMGDEARRNPYLAAEKFLQQRGVEVVKTTDIIDFDTIPTDQSVLLTKVDSMLVSPRQVAAARRWIEAGGYMIVGVEDELEGQTSLLNEFDITREYDADIELFDWAVNKESVADQMREMNQKLDEEEQKDQEPEAEPDPLDSPKRPEVETTESQWAEIYGRDQDHEFYSLTINEGEKIHLAVLDNLLLDHWWLSASEDEDLNSVDYQLETWVNDDRGYRLLQFSYGEGDLVVLSSTELWQNEHIALGDHAYLLSYLVPNDSVLQLFYNIKAPPLRHLLFKYFGEALWASIAFLLLWLWYRGARTQRVRNTDTVGRRNFVEHLQASAHYFVDRGQFDSLIHTLKLDIELQLRAQHPNFSTLPEAAQVAILVEKTNVSAAAIESWLAYCKQTDTREHFFSAIKLGNAIRKQL